MLRLSAWFGILTGIILAAAETALNWGHWQRAPFFIVDYVSAALILSGGVELSVRSMPGGKPEP